MFEKISHTEYPPSRPTMVWDGNCGFCKYWITRWKHMTGGVIVYKPYQEVADAFKDIPLKEFKKASRLIEVDGTVNSGPDSAYRCYDYTNKPYKLHKWYKTRSAFRYLSDHGYNWIAKHRSFMFQLTHLLFGKNPISLKPYWLLYLISIILIVYLVTS